jgi:peptide/nickel transport system substrate-binding protein
MRAQLIGAAALAAFVGTCAASAHDVRYGGTLVVGVTQDPGSLDPTATSTSTSGEIIQAMCLPLYRFEKNHGTSAYVPVLAAAIPKVSKDKLSYTVRLRQGIEFNDGTPLNADAVVATVNRFLTYPGSTARTNLADVDRVTRAGPYAVVYHLKQRDSTFIAGASYVLSPTAIQKEGADFPANPVCVGPFMFDHRNVGDNVTLVKSQYYYKRGAIHLDKLVFKVIADGAARVAALEAGDVQVIDSVATALLPSVQEKKNVRVLKAPQLGWQGIVINIGNTKGVGNLPYGKMGTPLAQSPKLRQAFEEAIDRQTLNRVVWDGLYQPSCTMVPQANTFWFDLIKVPCTGYDPQDARKLVAVSGIPNPTVHLLYAGAGPLAQFIQSEEQAVGIDVVIDTVDNATETARLKAGDFDTWLGAREPGSPDPHTTIYRLLDTNGDNDYGGYSNPRLDYVLANGLKAAQRNARAVNYRVAQQIIHDDRPLIVLYNRTSLVAYSTNVSGVALDFKGQVQLANAQLT